MSDGDSVPRERVNARCDRTLCTQCYREHLVYPSAEAGRSALICACGMIYHLADLTTVPAP